MCEIESMTPDFASLKSGASKACMIIGKIGAQNIIFYK